MQILSCTGNPCKYYPIQGLLVHNLILRSESLQILSRQGILGNIIPYRESQQILSHTGTPGTQLYSAQGIPANIIPYRESLQTLSRTGNLCKYYPVQGLLVHNLILGSESLQILSRTGNPCKYYPIQGIPANIIPYRDSRYTTLFCALIFRDHYNLYLYFYCKVTRRDSLCEESLRIAHHCFPTWNKLKVFKNISGSCF